MFRACHLIVLTIGIVLLSENCNAQNLIVTSAKKSFHINGEKIKSGDTLDVHLPVTIKEKGMLAYVFPNKWSSHIDKPGTYKFDTITTNIRSTEKYILHDSIFNVLQSIGLHDCHFNYHFTCKTIPGGAACDFEDDIKIQNDQMIRTNAESMNVSWQYPSAYTGKYVMVVSDMFDHYVGLIVTREPKIDLDLRRFKKELLIQYVIISEECRESSGNVIKFQ